MVARLSSMINSFQSLSLLEEVGALIGAHEFFGCPMDDNLPARRSGRIVRDLIRTGPLER